MFLFDDSLDISDQLKALAEDMRIKGGYRAVQTDAERTALPPMVLKEGMLVYVVEHHKLWIVSKLEESYDEYGEPVATAAWEEFKTDQQFQPPGARRARLIHTASLPVGASVVAPYSLGYSIALLSFAMSNLVRVTVSGDPEFKDVEEQFVWAATPTQKSWNGIVYLPDGTKVRNAGSPPMVRNVESPRKDRIYFRFDNLEGRDIPYYALAMTVLTLETTSGS